MSTSMNLKMTLLLCLLLFYVHIYAVTLTTIKSTTVRNGPEEFFLKIDTNITLARSVSTSPTTIIDASAVYEEESPSPITDATVVHGEESSLPINKVTVVHGQESPSPITDVTVAYEKEISLPITDASIMEERNVNQSYNESVAPPLLPDILATVRERSEAFNYTLNGTNTPITKNASSNLYDQSTNTISISSVSENTTYSLGNPEIVDDLVKPESDENETSTEGYRITAPVVSAIVGSPFCLEKRKCTSNSTDKTCFCDRPCSIFADCCEDADTVRDANLTSDQITCTKLPNSRKPVAYPLVTKCPSFFGDKVTKTLCEHTTETDDVISRVYVSDKTESGFIYKNRHCAHCNNVYEYVFWRVNISCVNSTYTSDINNCDLFFEMPSGVVPLRECLLNLPTSDCPPSYTDDDVRNRCLNGNYSVVYTRNRKRYWNEHCAVCNGEEPTRLLCQSMYEPVIGGTSRPDTVYSFRMLIDFNLKFVIKNEQNAQFIDCKEDEVYDAFSRTCRQIYCPPYTKPLNGKCGHDMTENGEGLTANYASFFHSHDNCTITKLEQNEYRYFNETNRILFRDTLYNYTDFWKNGSYVLICLETLNIGSKYFSSKVAILYPFHDIESYVSFVGLIVSITSSLATLAIYFMFPQLLNTPGKIVTCLIIALVTAQLLFLLAADTARFKTLCTVFAILMHYFFLSAFCWMNVIAFDLWVTFSLKFVSRSLEARKSKRFYFYSVYAWCFPLIIVSIALVFNYANLNGLEHFRPNYGHGVCWITSRDALLLFFAGPLGIFKLFDFVSFAFTVYHITKAKKQGALATRKGPSTSAFLINLRLSLVMGLTWAFAFVANFTNNMVMWYFFIVCNTLQGLFISISFLCTRKVVKLFRDKYERYSSQMSETQLTTRPSYKYSEY